MRKIIFRGKRLDNGKWAYGYYYCFANRHYIHEIEQHAGGASLSCYEVDPDTVGMSVGREDTDGAELYDGDLCVNQGGDVTAQITWNEKTIMWGLKVTSTKSVLARGQTFQLHLYFDPETMETGLKKVGNIYDNPELI